MITTFTYNIEEIVPYINWVYFFHAWQIPSSISSFITAGGVPSATEDEQKQRFFQEGTRLYHDACLILEEFKRESFHAKSRIGLFEANSNGDDILVYHTSSATTIPFLRQQHCATNGAPNYCLSDFIIPENMNKRDTIGIFACTVSHGMEDFHKDDAYKHLLVQTLSDRIAEAATEITHLKVRRDLWGYAPHEKMSVEELFREDFQGIRPAIGYPSIPDQSINFLLDDLIDMKGIGITLTANGAMKPHASVSGLMFSHPQSRYFSVGKIGEDQFQDYVSRRGLPANRMRQFLNANL